LTTYFDSSALAKLYIVESESQAVIDLVNAHTSRVTSILTRVEVRRVIARQHSRIEGAIARESFLNDLALFHVAALGSQVCERAAAIAEATSVRTLDSLHLATAVLTQCRGIVTFDRRQATVAAELGLDVIGI